MENRQTALTGEGKAAPFGGCATTFAPVGSVSLDFRVTAFPYKSSSLATPLKRGHYGCSALCHMTLWGSIEKPILPPE